MNEPFMESNIPDIPVRRGKVRDIYDFGDQLLLVATDRISAFDWVLPTGIPDKGRILTQISYHWLGELGPLSHFISLNPADAPLPKKLKAKERQQLEGRSMVVQKAEVIPIECIVRGYITGSGWKEYQQSGTVCGIELPEGLVESQQLPKPIFTPSTKAEQGKHDENITFDQMREILKNDVLAQELQELSLMLYCNAAQPAKDRGIIIADTKFEFGFVNGNDEPILIDEILTPDSSRFWPADQYEPGRSQPSFDKQFVRDWLTAFSWDKNSPPPKLPPDIVAQTRDKYIEAYEQLTGRSFAWK